MDAATILKEVNSLVDEYRAKCLWFLPADFHASSTAQALRVLNQIERHGDRRAFQRAAELKRWLSQHSSEPSAT